MNIILNIASIFCFILSLAAKLNYDTEQTTYWLISGWSCTILGVCCFIGALIISEIKSIKEEN